jgi:hypothetical protein
MADEEVRYSPEGVPLGKEEGDPEELLDDPTFEARLDLRLAEIGRRFGLGRQVGTGATAAGEDAPSAKPVRRRR